MEGIKILSLNNARYFKPKEDTLMIRIFGSTRSLDDWEEEANLEYEDYFRDIFSYQFDDIVSFGMPGSNKILFNQAHARQIIGDFKDVASCLDYLAVHCYAGISRSTAVASSLNHIFNLGVKDEDYLNKKIHRPNMHVYNTMIDTARELGMEFNFDKSGNSYFPEKFSLSLEL